MPTVTDAETSCSGRSTPRLNELDTANVEPMAQVASAETSPAKTSGIIRADTPGPCLPHEEALRNAPNSDGVFFKVPKVIER